VASARDTGCHPYLGAAGCHLVVEVKPVQPGLCGVDCGVAVELKYFVIINM